MADDTDTRETRRALTRALGACLRSGDPELVEVARARLGAILAGCDTELARAARLGLSPQKWLQWRKKLALDYPVHQVGRPINGHPLTAP